MAITGTTTRGFTFAVGQELTPAALNSLGEPVITISTPIAIADGGTNATSASAARSNLGLGSMATQASNSISIIGGNISGTIITLPSYSVSSLPSAGTAGRVVFCTDGDSGSKCLAVDDGTAWKRVSLGATVSAT